MSGAKPTTAPIEEEKIRQQVRDGYTAIAGGRGALAAVDAPSQARSFGYDPDSLALAPSTANLGLGCGNPVTRA